MDGVPVVLDVPWRHDEAVRRVAPRIHRLAAPGALLESRATVADPGDLPGAARALALTAQALHDVGGVCEVVVAVAWDCPFDGRTPVARTTEVCARAVELGADQLCLGDTSGTASPGRVWELLAAVRGWAAPRPRGPASV